jgi:Tol biopolymer transport system component
MRAALALVAAAIVFVFAPLDAFAQTPMVPYFGKNQIRYTNFRWNIYTTDHFEIYYYPEEEQHLERIAGYAESAYQHVSSDLKHDLAFKVPLIIFKTSSDFQQENVIPGAAVEGVGAFAEPERDRMLVPLDDPPDLLYRTITHELTHIFQFDIIPTSLIRRNLPLWLNEGGADYETGIWTPQDLMTVRDAAVADIVPKMSEMEGYGGFNNPRLIYNLGHACYEFIESRWGKEGVRQFLFALRKSVIGGGDDAYEEAFKLKGDEFDQQFERYLKERFKPFRDKERPADYGRNLAPNPEKTSFNQAISAEPSPSGDLIAVASGNRKEGELDIVLVSAKDGSIIRNLTNGFDQDKGWEYITSPGGRFNTVPWMSWSPSGDRIAFFVRREKTRTLIIQNVLTRKVEEKIDIKTVDDPESPDFSPDGKKIVFAGLVGAVGDLFILDLDTKQITNITKDKFADSGPTWAPDGKYIVYVARVSGNEKLFRIDPETGTKTQMTFGTHDDASAQFIDADTLVFPSTATDPNQPIDPDVARNGNIYNIWTLNLKNGELRQYTDAVSGNFDPIVLHQADNKSQIAFITYYKGDFELHTLERRDPIITAASADFGAPGPIIDFQAPLTHTLITANQRKKGTFEKLFLDGRPPVNVGVTSGGNVFGGSAVTFSDVLGDKQFNLYAQSISQYRTLSFSYINLSRRFNYAVQAYSQTLFFYGQQANVFYDPVYSPYIDRNLAQATSTIQGGSVFGIYPLNRYRRVELSGGVLQYKQSFNDPTLQDISTTYQEQSFGRQLFQNGTFMPLTASFVEETTIFREFGPLSGRTMRLSYETSPGVGGLLSRQTLDADVRKYTRLGTTGLLALRLRGFRSWGDVPDFIYFGGNSELRGYQYLQFLGSRTAFANAELRFPLIEAMLTPLGVLGGIRGVFFAGMGGAYFDGQPFTWWRRGTTTEIPIIGLSAPDRITGLQQPIPGPKLPVSGFRLVDSRASYGLGLETFLLGFPVHFDWAWRTLLNKDYEDVLFSSPASWQTGDLDGSRNFRKPKFALWIGYDF